MLREFYKGRRVFITGHTGFKGSWLSLWLHHFGAQVCGYALAPPSTPSLFEIAGISSLIQSVYGDVRDLKKLTEEMAAFRPEIIIHMAAQPLVRDSYAIPRETFEINTMGTVNLFEAVRQTAGIRSVINVTTDKCYDNKEWIWGYRENEPLGGYDPYSSSKACSELVTGAYRNSFFNPKHYEEHGVALASVRAGNVIGGGDWATDRLIPDCFRSLLQQESILIRSPKAIRPWQHVLEPLYGYMMLVEKLYTEGSAFSQAWNFGPPENDAKSVEWIVKKICMLWGNNACYHLDKKPQPHEATYLKLDCAKARNDLKWIPQWSLDTAIEKIYQWNLAYQNGEDIKDMCIKQIDEYERDYS